MPATVNNVVIPNIAKGPGQDDLWPHFWAATRAFKKCGWKYLAGGDGVIKDLSGDPGCDLWGEQIAQDAGQVWQVDADGGPSYVDLTTVFNSAATADVDPWPATEAIGDFMAVGFEGRFGYLDLDYTGGTAGVGGTLAVEYWNGSSWSAVTGLTDPTAGFTTAVGSFTVSWDIPADWDTNAINGVTLYYIRFRVTGVYSTNPVLDQGQVIRAGSSTGAFGSSASIGAIANGRATITGLTSMTVASKGRFLQIKGAANAANNNMHQIEEYLTATSVRVDARNFTMVGTDANNPSIEWEEFDPPTETQPASLDAVSAWSLWRGPSTIKIPITSAPVDGATGFIRGENVTQATTSAEGELLGYVFDTTSSTGYLVILPRLIGSGGNPFGWATANTITGDTSGATVDQDGTALEYRQQVVLRKDTTQASGQFYIQCIEPVGEAADSFLTLAATAGCTATEHPGGGTGSNTFPTIGYTNLGVGDGTTAANWSGSTAGSLTHGTNGQVIAVDALWEEDYSADGTWGVYSSQVSTPNGTALQGGRYGARGFYSMDDTEPGDFDPFITFGASLATIYAGNRLVAAHSSTSSDWIPGTSSEWLDASATVYTFFRGWQRRGLVTDDDYSDFELLVMWGMQTNAALVENLPVGGDNVVTEPTTTRAREPIRVGSMLAARKMRKGAIRHLQMFGGAGGGANTTYDGGKFIQLHEVPGAFVAGPWDETTVPVIG